jgi:hypothetical protein
MLCLVAATAWADGDSPHQMIKADGEPDEEKCAVCHNEDMDLLESKHDTCAGCHDLTTHSGAAEHLRADAATVKAHVPEAKDGVPELPLAEDGKMYCGTCHLFHDPKIDDVTAIPPRPLSSQPIAAAIRAATAKRWPILAQQHGEEAAEASFAKDSTATLRLPIDEGQLCRHCHGGMLGAKPLGSGAAAQRRGAGPSGATFVTKNVSGGGLAQ